MAVISIIVPVYNAEDYLRKCVDSILKQTFKDFELLLIDDGSTDNSPVICDEYACKDQRVEVIHQTNQGQAIARNNAVRRAKGQWICFVDSDDLIHPQMIECLYNEVIKNNVKISMCGAIESAEFPENFFSYKSIQFESFKVNERFLYELYQDGVHRYWVIWGKLIKKEIILNEPFTEGKIYEDNAVMCKWLVQAESVSDTKERLYFYFDNPHGTTKSGFKLKHLDFLWALEEQVNFYKRKNLKNMCKIISSRYVLDAAEFYRRICEEMDDKSIIIQIQKDLIKFTRKNRKYICVSKQQKNYINNIMYPKIMSIYWKEKELHKIYSEKGFNGLLFENCKIFEGKEIE